MNKFENKYTLKQIQVSTTNEYSGGHININKYNINDIESYIEGKLLLIQSDLIMLNVMTFEDTNLTTKGKQRTIIFTDNDIENIFACFRNKDWLKPEMRIQWNLNADWADYKNNKSWGNWSPKDIDCFYICDLQNKSVPCCKKINTAKMYLFSRVVARYNNMMNNELIEKNIN